MKMIFEKPVIFDFTGFSQKIDDSVPVPTPDRKYCETTAKSDEPFSGQDGQFRSAQIQDLLKNLPVKGPKSKVPKD